MKSYEILGKALDNLTPETWHKGGWVSIDRSRACLLGHLGWAAGCSLKRADVCNDESMEAEKFLRPHNPEGAFIARFNDDPNTTYEDVVLCLKKAYEDALDAEL